MKTPQLASGTTTINATDAPPSQMTPTIAHAQSESTLLYELIGLRAPLTQIRLIHLLLGADLAPVQARLTILESLHSKPFEALS